MKPSSGIIWLAALVVAAVIFVHMVPMDYLGRWSNDETNDVAHVLGFATLAFIAAHFSIEPLGERVCSTLLRYVIVAAVLAGLGVAAEAAQILTSRNENFSDVLRDLAGITAGLSAHWALVSGQRVRWAGLAAALGALGVGLFQPVMQLAAMQHAHRTFPALATFESALDLRAAQPTAVEIHIVGAPASWGGDGRVALLTPNAERNYHGLAFTDMPHDWRGYSRIVFRASAAAPTVLTVRINDEQYESGYADRFNRNFDIGEEPQTFTIPLSEVEAGPRDRRLDLSEVERIAFYVDGLMDAFLLDDIRLE